MENMIDRIKKGAVKTWNKAKYIGLIYFVLGSASCNQDDDDPVVPTNNPIEVNKSRETVNELSDEIKQDVIAYFQNIFCPIWNALWPDRPDLQFNPEDFVDIINNAEVKCGDEYFGNKSESTSGYYSPSGCYIRVRSDDDFSTIIHEFIHYLLHWKKYPATEETKKMLESTLGKLVSSDPTYDVIGNGEQFTTIEEARANLVKEIAHSLGGKPKDVTVEKLYEYIDEMNDYEIIYALQWINGYIDHEQFHSLYNDVELAATIERLTKSLEEMNTPSPNFLKDYFNQYCYEDSEVYTEEERFVKELISKNRWKIKEMPISEVKDRLNKKLKNLPSEDEIQQKKEYYQKKAEDQERLSFNEIIEKYKYYTEIEVVMKELEEQSKMVNYVGGNDNQRKELIDRVLEKIKKEREHVKQQEKKKIEDEIKTYKEKMNTTPEDQGKRIEAMRYTLKYIASVKTINFSDAQEMYCDQQSGGNEAMAA